MNQRKVRAEIKGNISHKKGKSNCRVINFKRLLKLATFLLVRDHVLIQIQLK